jgi:hypothetical protein
MTDLGIIGADTFWLQVPRKGADTWVMDFMAILKAICMWN